MSDYLSTTTYLPPIEEFGQRAPGQCTNLSDSEIPHSPFHILNDDVLLNIFHLYQLEISDEYDEDGDPNFYWSGQRWWYKLAQVCRRWRRLILASPSYLDLHLLCTHGVPIANMLAHSPPLPLAIYYEEDGETTEEDEEGLLLALRHSDRVHYISLNLPSPNLRNVITTMDEPFPFLERLYILSRTEGDTSLVLPLTFQAPNLRHLVLTTAVGLVTLALVDIPPSAYFPPSYLLTRLSLMPQLEVVVIEFHSPLPNRNVERQPLNTPIMTHVTLPNLRRFSFKGVSAYLELLARIRAPVLSNLDIVLFNQLTFTVPRLLQFMVTSEILNFSTVRLDFTADDFVLRRHYQGKWTPSPFHLKVPCSHLDWQVSSAAQILGALHPVLSVVEKLTLSHIKHNRSSEWHNEVDRTRWRQLLRPFSNLKTLHVQNDLVGKLVPSLQTDDGELPLEFLPNLSEIGYSGGDDARDAFTPFIDGRQVAGHSVNLTMVNDSEFSP
ncbi:hypothetical protein BJV78DRAFT_1155864 [Lactifluus subvellereus]|nr:hypothetical protein BJV78DRAFT_1155864 [Lactifluus subvellereus]